MAKHRRQKASTPRLVATASAVVMGSTLLAPGMASATEVVVPNTDIRVDVPGIENVPNVDQVPNVEQYIPSLAKNVSTSQGAGIVHQAQQAVNTQGQQVVAAARSAIGSPYGWGATGPNSFDCSGLTSWAYQQAGVNIPRTSQAQAAAGTPVSLDNLQPGDIVAYYGGATHVGIYTGNGTIIDALNSGSPVGERPLHFQPIHSAVRF